MKRTLLGCLLALSLCRATLLPAQTPAPTPAGAAPLPPVVARYEQMLAASPAKGTAFDKVYQYYFEGPGLDALAARWQTRAAAGGPGAETFPLLIGLLAERRAHPAEARTAYQQYADAHPDDPRPWTALGELESSEGHFAPAADAFTHALAPGAKPPVPVSTRPTLYRELARAQARSFLVAASLSTWRKLAAEFPDDPGILQEVGEAFQEDQAYDEARATFEKVRELARQTNDAFGRINATLRMGQVEEARGHAAEAVKVYEGVVAEAKTGSWLEREARARIEQLYRSQEDLPGLADYYKKWLDDHPKDTEVATRRAAVLIELNRRAEAIDLLKEAVVWAPERQELQVELARRLGEADRPAEMAAVMEKLTTVAPEEKSYWQLLGDARWQLLESLPTATATAADRDKLRAQALAAWSHLSPADGKDPAATGQLADLLASHHLKDEALAQYARAAALAPDLPDARERWAAFLAQIDRKDEARTVVAGIVAGGPKNANAANYARLGAALDRLDDPDGALAATEKGLALEPRNFDLLSQRWQLLTGRKRWADAAALYPALLAAAPNAYFAEQVQTRQVAALQAANQLADTRTALGAHLGDKTPTPLDENDLALLVRIDLQAASSDTDADALVQARQALAEGRARFSRAAAFARLEGDLAKRARDVDGQVAALRRLFDLQPAQKTDALAEIARVYRDAGRADDAVTAANELVLASPANAAAHVLLADLLLQANHVDEGIARLEDAVRLSDKPNDVRLRLARVEADLGRNGDARRTLDDAFENAEDSHERLSITKALADAYLRENRLDELITRFQKLQQGEAEGWRYALYLSEIYQQTKDFGAARRELAKALAARPHDGALLRQLVRIAEEEQNTSETARYQSLLAEVEPSDQNKLALVTDLLEDNQAAAGLSALRANLSAILKISGAWDQLLPLLARNDLTSKAGDLLTAEMGGEHADVKARFTLALFQAVAGNVDQARAAFWSVFDEKTPPAPLPGAPATPRSTTAVGTGMRLASVIYSGDSIPEQRYRAGEMTRRTAQGLLYPGGFAGFGRGGVRGFFGMPTAGSGLANTPSPTETARDAALLYLAALAVKDHTAAEFLSELDHHLDARDSSRADRLVARALMEDVEGETREIAAQVQNPEPGLDGLALSRTALIAYNNNPQFYRYSEVTPLTTAQTAALAPLFEPLLARVLHADPSLDNVDAAPFRYSFLLGLRQKEKAEVVRRDFLAGVTAASSPERLESALGLLVEGDFNPADRALLKTVVAACTNVMARAGNGAGSFNQHAYYPTMIFQDTSGATKLSAEDFADVLASLLPLWYPLTPPPAGTASATANTRYRFPGSEDSTLPATRFFDANTLQSIRAVSQYLHQGDGARSKLVRDRLDQQAKDLPPARQIFPQLTAIYLDAYGGDPAGALPRAQTLLAAAPDDNDLRLIVGVLLGHTDHHAEALALLETVDQPRTSETPFDLQMLVFAEARAANDTESAKRAALRLAAMHVPPEQREPLSVQFRELGLTAQADALSKPAAGSGNAATASAAHGGRQHSIFDSDTVQRIEKFNADKNEDGALGLARNVLAALPPPPPGPYGGTNEDYVLRSTVETIKRYKKLPEFVADAEKQLAKDPDSLSLNYQLAVLHQESGGIETAETRAHSEHRAPVWIKLARVENDETAGFYSLDGQTWTEIARAKVPLGDAPLAALPAASSQHTPIPTVVMDHLTLTPPPSEGSPATADASGTLPAPWAEAQLSADDLPAESPPPAPVSVRDGTWTLPTRGWDLWGTYDDGRLVHRPLGGITEMSAQIVSEEGGTNETKTGVMFRASLDPDAPYAAVIVLPGGGITFQHRDRTDGSTAYWRKLVTLRPRESRYQMHLAHRLAERGLRDDAMAVFNQLVDRDPDEAFADYNDVQFVYRGRRIISLAERILQWKPGSSGSPNTPRSAYGYAFAQVARECVNQKRPDLVVALCRRGLELDSVTGAQNPDLSKLLVSALLDLGRRDEARDALVANFLPPTDAGKTAGAGGPAAIQLGFRNPMVASRFVRSSWMSSLSWNVDSVELYGLQPLEGARIAGLLPDVEAALVARQKSDPEGFANNDLGWLLTLIRLDLHDPALLEELPALLAAKPHSAGNASRYVNEQSEVAVRQAVAKRLLQWPGHETLALEAFRASQQTLADAKRGNNTFSNMLLSAINFQEARAELLLDDPRSATATLHALASELTGPNASTNGNSHEEIRRCLGLMLRGGPDADAGFLDLFTRAIKTPDTRKALNFAYDLERDVRVGDNPHFQALAWLLDDGGTDAAPDATLVYELRPEHPFDKTGLGRYPTSRVRSFPGSEGPRTLTISYGPDAEHFAPLGQVQTERTFGTWTGPIPKGSGLLKVTIDTPRAQDTAALAAAAATPAAPGADYWLRVVRTPNLLANPGFDGLSNRDPNTATFAIPGWKDLPGGLWKQGTGDNPRPGHPYVQSDTFSRQSYTITGTRIPWEAGRAYFQSGWVRDGGDNNTVRVGRRYLDANGNVLKTSECPGFSTLGWRWHSQRLLPKAEAKDDDSVPSKTAFIEPFLRVQGSNEWTGLFLGKME